MSWFSNLFHDSSGDEARMAAETEATRARNEQINRDHDAALQSMAHSDALARRGAATDNARSSANSYFSSLGLDPAMFSGDLDTKINDILYSTADDDPNVGGYFQDLGKQVYDTKESAARTKGLRDLNTSFAPDFETSRISDNLDDPIISQVDTGERGKADDYINNLFKRGVLSDSGKAAAESNVNDQGARVRSILNELGGSSLEAGRSKLSSIANRGRQAASGLTLGQDFDPSKYTSEADTAFNDFVGGLGDSIKSKIPTNLYDTSKLASIGGAAQGAGNLAFDPKALAGTNIGDPLDSNANPLDDPNKRITF